MVNQSYGKTFLRLCESKAIKMAEVSKKSGVAKSTFSRFVNGHSSVTIDQLELILEVIHSNMAEFYHYATNAQEYPHEDIFIKIEKASIMRDQSSLKKIYEQNINLEKHRRLIALSAKARWSGLTKKEVIEVSDFLFGAELFTLYDLKIFKNTMSELSTKLIHEIITAIIKDDPIFIKNVFYRKIIGEIACKATCILVQRGQQVEAHLALTLAKNCCFERESYLKKLAQFSLAYYNVFYGKAIKRAEEVSKMKQIIEVFEREGSKNLSSHLQQFFEKNVPRFVASL